MPTIPRPAKPFVPVVSTPSYPKPKPPSGLGNRSKSMPSTKSRRNGSRRNGSRRSASRRNGSRRK